MIDWIIENKEFISILLTALFIIVIIIVRLTPNKKDDKIIDEILDKFDRNNFDKKK
jgi:hypothetical protein